MQSHAIATAAALRQYLETSTYTHAADLVLEPLPLGELAWLKPADDEPRYALTDAGRRDLRMAELFGASDAAA
jgi:hypothetical protein